MIIKKEINLINKEVVFKFIDDKGKTIRVFETLEEAEKFKEIQDLNLEGMTKEDLELMTGMSITCIDIYSFKQLCMSRRIENFWVPGLERGDENWRIDAPMDLVRWRDKFISKFGKKGVISLPMKKLAFAGYPDVFEPVLAKIECSQAYEEWEQQDRVKTGSMMKQLHKLKQ